MPADIMVPMLHGPVNNVYVANLAESVVYAIIITALNEYYDYRSWKEFLRKGLNSYEIILNFFWDVWDRIAKFVYN